MKVGEGIAGCIVQTGEPLLIKDITKESRFSRREGRRYYTNSLLSVPLKIHDKVIGVINVNNKISKDIFGTVAIENARLHERAKAVDKLRVNFVSMEIILDEIAGSINKKQRDFLRLAKENVDRLGRLIDGLLELVKLESEKGAIKRKLFNIVKLVETVIITLKPLTKDKRVLLTSQLS